MTLTADTPPSLRLRPIPVREPGTARGRFARRPAGPPAGRCRCPSRRPRRPRRPGTAPGPVPDGGAPADPREWALRFTQVALEVATGLRPARRSSSAGPPPTCMAALAPPACPGPARRGPAATGDRPFRAAVRAGRGGRGGRGCGRGRRTRARPRLPDGGRGRPLAGGRPRAGLTSAPAALAAARRAARLPEPSRRRPRARPQRPRARPRPRSGSRRRPRRPPWARSTAAGPAAAAATSPLATSTVAPSPWACSSSGRGLHLDLEVEQVADRLLLDGLGHRLEQLVALALVLHERVALGHGPQADALLQVVHLVEVLAPLAVEHRQHDPALELAHGLGAERLLAPVVGELGVAA